MSETRAARTTADRSAGGHRRRRHRHEPSATTCSCCPTTRSWRSARAAPARRRVRDAASASRACTPSYAELVADPHVDAVYVATPHPDAPRRRDARDRGGQGGARREAVHDGRGRGALAGRGGPRPRHVPHGGHVDAASCRTSSPCASVLESGRIGDLVLVTAEHGQWFAEDPDFRLFAPGLGGGALLDLGIYPVSFASMVLGTPTRITAVSDPAFTGVDAQTSMILRDDGGAPRGAHHDAARPRRRTARRSAARDGRIEIEPTFYRPDLVPASSTATARCEHVEVPHVGNGLRHQAAEVGRCLREGLTESPRPHPRRDRLDHGDDGRDPPPDRPHLPRPRLRLLRVTARIDAMGAPKTSIRAVTRARLRDACREGPGRRVVRRAVRRRTGCIVVRRAR